MKGTINMCNKDDYKELETFGVPKKYPDGYGRIILISTIDDFNPVHIRVEMNPNSDTKPTILPDVLTTVGDFLRISGYSYINEIVHLKRNETVVDTKELEELRATIIRKEKEIATLKDKIKENKKKDTKASKVKGTTKK